MKIEGVADEKQGIKFAWPYLNIICDNVYLMARNFGGRKLVDCCPKAFWHKALASWLLCTAN